MFNGVATHIINIYPGHNPSNHLPGHFTALFERSTFSKSVALYKESKGNTSIYGATLVASYADKIDFKNCQFTFNNFTAISVYRTSIRLSGIIQIENNTGINGGGLLLCESSYAILTNHSIIKFAHNHAMLYGGGIYIENECFHSKPFCFFQFDPYWLWKCDNISRMVQFVMINNTAGLAGDHIYGGALDYCYINNCNSKNVFKSLFNITPRSSPSFISSNARKICNCIGEEIVCGNGTIFYPEAVFPGEEIEFGAVIVGQTVPGTVLVNSQYSENTPIPQTTWKKCTTLHAIVTAKEGRDHAIIKLHLLETPSNYSIPIGITEPLYMNVQVKTCPPGFVLSNHSCDCDKVLKDNHVRCEIRGNAAILREPPEWIGYDLANGDQLRSKGIIYHDICPYDFCSSTPVNITSHSVFDQDSQCAPNRTGILCSKCKEGLSLSSGSSDCIKCPNKGMVAMSVLGLGLAGLLLVLVLVALDLTYTEGTLSGLLFYVNTINLNSSIFLLPQYYNVLTILLSWINLSPGFRVCFYDGMDAYVQTWLTFCFPLYLFLITVLIILLCRSSSRCAQLFGKNIVKVLATILLLSYTDLIQSVLTVFSYTVINYHGPNNTYSTKLVWLYDPSMEYFTGKHLPLAAVGIAFSFFILIYTLVLLFIQPLQRYSHLFCFKWMITLKPLVDAYTSPHIIRDSCRNWEGLLLLFRLVLATTNLKGRIDINLTAITLVSVLLLSTAWSVGGVYKKTSLNMLNCVSILNLAALSIAINFMNKSKKYTNQFKEADSYAISHTSFGIAVLIFLFIFALYIFKTVRLCCAKLKRRKYRALDMMPSLHQPQ
jgi:hypothetical protein